MQSTAMSAASTSSKWISDPLFCHARLYAGHAAV
jgi:hypothetical protein